MVKKVVFLGMGGTIAGTAAQAADNVGYTAAQVGVQQLLASVPGLQAALAGHPAHAEQVCQIDSKDLAVDDWVALHARVTHHLAQDDVAGVVVTHGTDTLEETAFFLSQTLAGAPLAHKPVVLTCAMRPASSLAPDGPGNMADAAALAVCAGARGVLVVCAGKVHGAAEVQKVHPYRTDAFDSGEAGPVAVVEEGQVRRLSAWPMVDAQQQGLDLARAHTRGWPRVELLVSHAGASSALLQALLQSSDPLEPLRGIVVAGTGNGTIHRRMEAALQQAQAQGIRVLRTSRCPYGQVVGGAPGARSGAFAAVGLSPVKARIALMLELLAQA